jgi:membrane associated rhomboid family serine protease
MQNEGLRFTRSLIFPLFMTVVMWAIMITGDITGYDFAAFGLIPLQAKGLPGIIFSPLIHGNFHHLMANTLPFLVLATALFYFYTQISWWIFWMIYLMAGTWVWFLARGDDPHVGASGVVYGLASFLFFSGLLRRHTQLMALSLFVAFFYGSLIWGIFPQFFPHERISWEGHAMGLLSGIILAFYYRGSGPQRKRYEWEDREEEETDLPWDQPFESNDE